MGRKPKKETAGVIRGRSQLEQLEVKPRNENFSASIPLITEGQVGGTGRRDPGGSEGHAFINSFFQPLTEHTCTARVTSQSTCQTRMFSQTYSAKRIQVYLTEHAPELALAGTSHLGLLRLVFWGEEGSEKREWINSQKFSSSFSWELACPCSISVAFGGLFDARSLCHAKQQRGYAHHDRA